MNYGSVCSGIEAATSAWHPLGWKPQFFSEIEPFPSRVLAHHYPTVPNLGDMTQFKTWPDYAIRLLVGGTPCQSFSVAGLRKGLDDPRGNLMLTYLAIAARYRPRWLVWENVPGVLSSNGGRDFGTFLGGLGELGYGFAYRVLDAQYVRVESHARAVPQRRRRVFVVGCLGDWRRAAAVLFERESLCGHPPPRRHAGKTVAGTFGSRATGGGGFGTDFDLVGGVIDALRTKRPGEGGISGDDTHLVSSTLDASYADKWGLDNQHIDGGAGLFVARSLLGKPNSSHAEDQETYVPAISPALNIQSGQHHAPDSIDLHTSENCGLSLQKSQGQSIHHKADVRRLTPRECEALMGFPRHFTAIPGAKDGPRYKALGNSMACNVMRWIGERIAMVDGISPDNG